MTIGETLKMFRIEKKVSQLKLANRIRWSESRICQIENDTSDNIGIRTIERYLEGLDITPLEFYTKLYSN